MAYYSSILWRFKYNNYAYLSIFWETLLNEKHLAGDFLLQLHLYHFLQLFFVDSTHTLMLCYFSISLWTSLFFPLFSFLANMKNKKIWIIFSSLLFYIKDTLFKVTSVVGKIHFDCLMYPHILPFYNSQANSSFVVRNFNPTTSIVSLPINIA